MAVFTEVSPAAAQALLTRLQLGELRALRGIEGGIENTNYFVTTDTGEFVLTLFERLSAEQLPFYLHLMRHLAHAGIPVPEPQADARGEILHSVCGKPAAVVNKLHGRSQLAPQAVHCAAVGAMLARMHLAGQGFERQQVIPKNQLIIKNRIFRPHFGMIRLRHILQQNPRLQLRAFFLAYPGKF